MEVTSTEAQNNFGQYMKFAGIPVALIVLVSTYFVALRVQKNTEGKEAYGKDDMVDTSNFKPNEKTKRATLTFVIVMLVSIVYGIYAKAGASFVITVMGITSLAVGFVAGLKPDETLKAIVKGSSRMYWLFILFVLYDPFLNFVTQSGAFDALAGYIKPLINAGGKPVFMIVSTLIGIFGVSGAAVAQEKVVHTMFLPLVKQLNFPMTLWSIVLLVGILLILLLSPPIIKRVEQRYGDDPSIVVIDEVLGTWIVFCSPIIPTTFLSAIIGLSLFRLFDISKPWIIQKINQKKGALYSSDSRYLLFCTV